MFKCQKLFRGLTPQKRFIKISVTYQTGYLSPDCKGNPPNFMPYVQGPIGTVGRVMTSLLSAVGTIDH